MIEISVAELELIVRFAWARDEKNLNLLLKRVRLEASRK